MSERDYSSEDEAPEAVSFSTGREKALEQIQIEENLEEQAKQKKETKEKRKAEHLELSTRKRQKSKKSSSESPIPSVPDVKLPTLSDEALEEINEELVKSSEKQAKLLERQKKSLKQMHRKWDASDNIKSVVLEEVEIPKVSVVDQILEEKEADFAVGGGKKLIVKNSKPVYNDSRRVNPELVSAEVLNFKNERFTLAKREKSSISIKARAGKPSLMFVRSQK